MPSFWTNVFHNIERNWIFHIKWCEIYNIVNTLLRYVLKKEICRFTVRIDEGETITIANILNRKVFKQSRFTHTCLTDRVHVPRPIFTFNAKLYALIPSVSFSKICYFFLVIHAFVHIISYCSKNVSRESLKAKMPLKGTASKPPIS